MNLRDFLNHKIDCPFCQNPLTTVFHSERRQKIRYEENRLIIIFPLDGLNKKQTNYKVGYSFGMDDNSFRAEFYTYDEQRFNDESPLFLVDRFRKLDQNLADYKIYKHCHKCGRYNYGSPYIKIDFKSGTFSDLNINTEFFIFVKKAWDGHKIYKMLNYYNSKETWLNYGKVNDPDEHKLKPIAFGSSLELPNTIHTGIIVYTSPEEVTNRLDKLILFS